jgi:hypothetical protein
METVDDPVGQKYPAGSQVTGRVPRAHDAHQGGPRIVRVDAQVERVAGRVGQCVPPFVAAQQAGAELLGAFRRRIDVRYPEVEMGLGRAATGNRR